MTTVSVLGAVGASLTADLLLVVSPATRREGEGNVAGDFAPAMERIAPVMAVAISLDAIDNLQLDRARIRIPMLIDIDTDHEVPRGSGPPRHNFYSLYIGIRAEGLAADADAFAK